MILIYTPDQVLRRGLSLAGMDVDRQEKQNRESCIGDFKAAYGIHPLVLAQIWEDLQTTTIPTARIIRPKTRAFCAFQIRQTTTSKRQHQS
jgi:hypothetical protein